MRREVDRMSLLDRIFDKETMREGDKVLQQLENYYERSGYLAGVDNDKRPELNFLLSLLPYFFKKEFSGVDSETMNTLCICSAISAQIVLYYDHLVDNCNGITETDISLLFEKFMFSQYQARILGKLFDENSEFWSYYEKYCKQYFEAAKLEMQCVNSFKKYEYSEFKKISRGVFAMWKWPIAALAVLTGNTHKIAMYEEVLDLEAEADQLFDDLKDWKDDFNGKRFSWMLCRIMVENEIDPSSDVKTVSEFLFKGDYDLMVLVKINKLCEKIMLKCGNADEYIIKIREFQSNVNKLYNDLCRIKEHGFIPQDRPSVNENLLLYGTENFIQNFMDILTLHKKKDYPELVHWALFTKQAIVSADNKYIRGDVYQRAVVLNSVLELKRMGYKVQNSFIQDEIEYFIRMWDETKKGWSYFSKFPKSQADIDILAEMMKICILTENTGLKMLVDESVSFLIKNRKNNKEGLFNKYYTGEDNVDTEGNLGFSLSDSGMMSFGDESIQDCFDNPMDYASNASLLYAMLVYDGGRYSEEAEGAIRKLMEGQGSEGSWNSKWYHSNYYTSGLIAKIFKANKSKSINAQKLAQFIQDTYNGDGSWGETENSMFETVFSASMLIEIDYMFDKEYLTSVLKKSMEYILSHMRDDGFFDGTPFVRIVPKADEKAVQTYKSSLFTTVLSVSTVAVINKYLKEKDRKEF